LSSLNQWHTLYEKFISLQMLPIWYGILKMSSVDYMSNNWRFTFTFTNNKKLLTCYVRHSLTWGRELQSQTGIDIGANGY